MSFRDIKGQEEAIKFLKTTIKSGKTAHAYIFAGPPGCGRSLLARNFAKALNCEDSKTAPCDSCISCQKIDRETHPDVIWVRKEEKSEQIKIEQIRQLQDGIALKPYEGKYRVCVIIDAGLMTIEAANSFLKTLEEPPSNSLIILIAEKQRDLIPTITSRCQIVRLKPVMTDVPTSTVADVLEEFSDDECTEDYTAANREELSKKLNVLASWYRDLLVFKSTSDGELLIHCDREKDIKKNTATCSMNDLMRMFEGVLSAKEKIESNVNPKLALSALFKELGL